MSEKRRDNKNRILRNGESQHKDGRYMYKYIDNAGNVKYIYNWKLVKADTVVNDSVTREAITRKQERNFLEFVKNDNHFSKYYEGIYILLKMGLRISEFTGLTKRMLLRKRSYPCESSITA